MDKYQSLWTWEPQHKVALEASTTYTRYPQLPHVAERIAQVKDAQFRFIYIMRDPITRIESHMRHLLSNGRLEKPEIIEEHISVSQYAKQLDIYVNMFGRDRLHLLLLEDLQQNPQVELRRICEFLEIDPDYQFQRINVVMNSNATLNLHPTVRKIYQIPLVKKSLGSLIPPSVRQKFYKPLARKKAYETNLSPKDKQLIMDQLLPDLQRLKTEYGINFHDKWNVSLIA